MIFGNYALAKRIERAEAANQRLFVETHKRLRPDSPYCALEADTGQAVFAGEDSPLTQAFGLGFAGEVATETLDALEDFFRSQGAPVVIEASQLADMSLPKRLIERGYSISEYSNALALALGEAPEFELSGARVIRRVETSEALKAAETIASGFLEYNPGEQPVPDDFLDLFVTALHQPNNKSFVALDNAENSDFAGVGALYVLDGVAFLGGASTVPRARRRGVQSDLIRARLNQARSEGCDLAVVSTLPGSASQSNMHKFGFAVAYSRVKFLKEWK